MHLRVLTVLLNSAAPALSPLTHVPAHLNVSLSFFTKPNANGGSYILALTTFTHSFRLLGFSWLQVPQYNQVPFERLQTSLRIHLYPVPSHYLCKYLQVDFHEKSLNAGLSQRTSIFENHSKLLSPQAPRYTELP